MDEDGQAYCLLDHPAALAWAANPAALELRPSLALAKAPHRPTCQAFDLDPGAPASLADRCRLWVLLRDVLAGVGLQSFPKSSGGKGLHAYAPLNTPCTFAQTKAFAQPVALARDDPKVVTADMRKDRRPGWVFIDWSQNDRHEKSAAVYSLRATDRPTVSAPVTWDEVGRGAGGNTGHLVFEAGVMPGRGSTRPQRRRASFSVNAEAAGPVKLPIRLFRRKPSVLRWTGPLRPGRGGFGRGSQGPNEAALNQKGEQQ